VVPFCGAVADDVEDDIERGGDSVADVGAKNARIS
jgi:hypothetical protein